MKNHTDYFDSVTRCMMVFQHIEEALKMILIRLEALTFLRLKEYSHYSLKPKISSIRNAAMGRLIEMLSIYCDSSNDDMIMQLRKVKKWRDNTAHQSLLMTVDEMNDKINIHEKTIEMEKHHKEAEALMHDLSKRWGDLDKTLNELTR